MLKAEVIPNQPRYYEYVKYFEENPKILLSKLSKFCKVRPSEVYSGRDAQILTYDCEDIVIDVVIAERGATIYVYTPGLKKIDDLSIISGAVLGGITAFASGYFFGLVVGLFAGLLVYIGSTYGIRKFLLKNNKVVEMLEKIKEL